jgi:hypothetical protein
LGLASDMAQCDICKVDEAISLYSQSFSYYCDAYYKLVHEKNKNKE